MAAMAQLEEADFDIDLGRFDFRSQRPEGRGDESTVPATVPATIGRNHSHPQTRHVNLKCFPGFIWFHCTVETGIHSALGWVLVFVDVSLYQGSLGSPYISLS